MALKEIKPRNYEECTHSADVEQIHITGKYTSGAGRMIKLVKRMVENDHNNANDTADFNSRVPFRFL